MIGIVNDGDKKEYPVEQEQNMTMQQVQNAFGQTAIQLGSIADSLGVMSTAIKKHDNAIRTLGEQQKATDQKIDDLTSYIKETEYIEPFEVRELHNAIKSRVADLLGSINRIDEKYLWACVMRKCWGDCKKYSMMAGNAGVYTKRRHYNEVLNYIGGWEPEGYGGLTGYINHLDLSKGA